jgi:hypothetical protein
LARLLLGFELGLAFQLFGLALRLFVGPLLEFASASFRLDYGGVVLNIDRTAHLGPGVLLLDAFASARDDRRFFAAAEFAGRSGLHAVAAGLFDDLGLRPFVNDVVIDDLDIRNIAGVVDDGGVVHDYGARTNRFQEVAFLNKNVATGRDSSHIHVRRSAVGDAHGRLQRRPA